MTPRRRLLAFSTMLLARHLGVVFSPLLLVHAPVALLVVSPFIHHLVATVPLIPLPVFLPVALASTLFQAWVGRLFGLSAGPKVQAWLIRRSPRFGSWIRDRAQKPLGVFLVLLVGIPGPLSGATVGAFGAPARVFWPMVLAAEGLWLGLCVSLRGVLTEWVERLQGFLVTYGLPLTLVLLFGWICRMVVQRYRRRRR